MVRKYLAAFCFLNLIALYPGRAQDSDLAAASSEELLGVYQQLRQIPAGDRWAVAENVVWKRDAATFTFVDGRLTFSAPVGGRVVAAVFSGLGRFELNPPTPIAQRQIARFSGDPHLRDSFREAVFFFTDESAAELENLVRVQTGEGGGDWTVVAAAQKKYAENFNDWWSNQRRGNPEMRNLAARMLADLSDPTSRGFFLADFKGDRSGDLLFHISWNRDPILLPDWANDEEVMLLKLNLGNYYEWWAGFHLAGEYAENPWPEHRTLLATCVEQHIEAEVGKDRELSAKATLKYQVPGGTARLLPLSLRGVMRISSVEDGTGQKLGFIQEARDRDNDPWLILPSPAAPGKTYEARITYAEDSTRDSRIIYQQGPGLYYVTSRTSWFPSFGALDDRSHYRLRVRSPKKFRFIATGRLVREEKEKDFLVTEWEPEMPLSVVGFNYGEFVEKSQKDARFTVTAYAGRQIPDELRAVQGAIDMAELAGGPGGPKNIAGQLGIATGGFNTSRMVGHAANVSFTALKLFEHYFGPLPFRTISVTQQPIRGYGQSWPTLIFLPYDSLLDSTTRNSLRLQDSAEAREFYNTVAVHEMAHQWWGHVVGWKTYHDQWLSEGLAEFSAALFLKQFEPKKWNSFWNLKRKWLLSKNPEGNRPVDVGPLWLNAQLATYREPSLRQQLIYDKGAYVLEMLRTMMEDPTQPDPDARFIAMMKDFVSTYTGKNASTEDFRRIVEKHANEPMQWFFDQWVYGTEIPEYSVTSSFEDLPGGKVRARVTLNQSGVSDSFRSYVPFFAVVKGEPRRLGIVRILGSSSARGELTLPFRPDKITIDESRNVLCVVR